MNRQDEQQVLKQVYKDADHAAKDIEQGLLNVLNEELSLEMNLFLEQWKQFVKRAEKRIGTNIQKDSDTAAEQSELKEQESSELPEGRLVQRLIERNQSSSDHLKYAIHEWKEAGIYATELAKDMIDFEQSAVEKLKIYL